MKAKGATAEIFEEIENRLSLFLDSFSRSGVPVTAHNITKCLSSLEGFIQEKGKESSEVWSSKTGSPASVLYPIVLSDIRDSFFGLEKPIKEAAAQVKESLLSLGWKQPLIAEDIAINGHKVKLSKSFKEFFISS